MQSLELHCRILGHLSSVFCVAFDRTGRYIVTVSVFYSFLVLQSFSFAYLWRMKAIFYLSSTYVRVMKENN